METAKQEPKWLYRLEAKDPNNGLWYNLKNEYVWGCKDCKGEAKNLPMGYDERYHIDGKNWFSSCSKIEDLLHWYSKEDAKYLLDNGFVFTKYLAKDYHEFEKETVFLKDTALERVEISFDDLFGEPNEFSIKCTDFLKYFEKKYGLTMNEEDCLEFGKRSLEIYSLGFHAGVKEALCQFDNRFRELLNK